MHSKFFGQRRWWFQSSSFLQSWFRNRWLPSWPCELCTRRTPFFVWRRDEIQRAWGATAEFYGTSIQRLKQRSKKCVNNEEDLVEKQTQPCKGCAQVKRKFNYDYSNSFWERIRWHYFCSVPRINVSFIRNVTSGQGTHYHHESTSVQI